MKRARRTKKTPGRVRGFSPRVESLEDRRMLDGASWEVNTWLDPSAPYDPNDGILSLREAIAEAQVTAGHDHITFAGTLSGSTILLNSTLAIDSDVTIQGPGQSLLEVAGALPGSSGAFDLFSVAVDVTAELSGLRIARGTHGILNYGILTVQDATISGNVTTDWGAGIANSAPTRCLP